MNLSRAFVKISIACALFGIIFFSCETDPEAPIKEKNDGSQGNGSNSADDFTPDELSEFLSLNDAGKIAGALPKAPDLQLKINVKDTIYVAKGFPLGARVVIWHNGLHDITGFYVSVVNGSFYYDAPVTEGEAGDSTDVIYIDIAIPADISVDYPFTIPVKIQPHDASGEPLDEFVRDVTIEDPQYEEVCLPTSIYHCEQRDSQTVCSTPWKWIWEFTAVKDNTGDIRTVYAPGVFVNKGPFQHGGCCWNNISIPAKYDPYCVSGNPEYFELTVDDEYYVRFFEAMDLFDNGKFERAYYYVNQYYHPDSSNYCTGEAGYVFDENFLFASGDHDFSPEAGYIHFTNTSISGGNNHIVWFGLSGNVTYTCHSLIISYPFNGEMWTEVFRRQSDLEPGELEDFFFRNWD